MIDFIKKTLKNSSLLKMSERSETSVIQGGGEKRLIGRSQSFPASPRARKSYRRAISRTQRLKSLDSISEDRENNESMYKLWFFL